MPGYTKVNLQDVNNLSHTEGNEAHFSRKFLDSKELGVSLFRFMPNYRSGRAHKHRVQEEVYVVIKGSGQILLDDKVEDLNPWDTVRVAPEVVRSFASGPEGLELIAIGGKKPEEGDGVPQDADWPSN